MNAHAVTHDETKSASLWQDEDDVGETILNGPPSQNYNNSHKQEEFSSIQVATAVAFMTGVYQVRIILLGTHTPLLAGDINLDDVVHRYCFAYFDLDRSALSSRIPWCEVSQLGLPCTSSPRSLNTCWAFQLGSTLERSHSLR